VYPKRHLCRFVIFRYPPSIPLVSSHSSIYSCSVCRLSPNVVLLLFDVLEVEQQARLTTALRVVEKKNVTLPTVLCPSSFSFLCCINSQATRCPIGVPSKACRLGNKQARRSGYCGCKIFRRPFGSLGDRCERRSRRGNLVPCMADKKLCIPTSILVLGRKSCSGLIGAL
jgi:hypothetical protein